MTPQELKNSILQLAIQGKLVDQRPEEGTAEELYRQIQAEKQALIKAGKIKKEKPLPEITEDEIPFEIPESWKWVRLSELCSIVTGKRDANFGTPDGEYFFFTCAKDPIKCSSFSFSGESILLAGNGDIGNISYYWGQFEAYQRTYVLQPYIENTYLIYLFHHLQCNWVQYNRGMVFGTAIPYIRLGNVQNYTVALPPLAEQKRIVAKIEELLPLIDRYEQAWTRLEDFNKRFPGDMQKSLLQLAIQGKLVPQRPEEGTGEDLYRQIQAEKQALIKAGKIKKEKPLPEITEDEIPFEIPSTWRWCHISDMCYFQEGPGILAKDFRPAGIPLIRIAGMQGHQVSLEGCNYLEPKMVDEKWSHFKLDKGDIVISTSASLDKIAEVTDIAVGAIPYTGLIRFKMYGNISKEFFTYYIKSPCYINQIAQQEAGSTIKHYGPTHLKKMIIPLPPLAEQKRIVAKLESLLPLCDKLK